MARGQFDLTKTLGASSYIYSRCEWSSTGSIDTNKSTIDVKVIVGKRTGSQTPTSCTFNTNVSVIGAETANKSSSPYGSVSGGQEITVFSDTFVVPHNDEGKKTTTISVSIGNNNVYHASGSAEITLDTIPRASSIAVSNYDLGQNISITIGKKVSSFTSTLTYKIGERTGTIAEKISDGSYIWEMPEELISQIKQDNPSNRKPSATIYCDTYSGDTKIGDTKSATFTLFITDKPTITNVTMVETMELIKQYTSSIVKYLSVPKFDIATEPSEGTTISNYKIKINEREVSSSANDLTVSNIQYSYLVDDVRKTKFIISVTDARGNVSDEYLFEVDFIEYVQLAFKNTDITLTRLNGTSNSVKLHMTGYVYNGLVGETQNTLSIQYRYKLKNDNSAEWSELKTINATLNDDNTFIINNFQFEDEFDYRDNYDIEFHASDLFTPIMYATVVKTSETIAKWHKNGAYIKEIDTNKLKVGGEEVPKTENVESTSTLNAYSCDYINKLNTYSTEETIIGTWIDGKPLYRKVLQFTDEISVNMTKAHNIIDASRVWCDLSNCYFTSSVNNMTVQLPVVLYYHDTSDKVDIQVDLENIYIYCDGTWDTKWIKVISLYYTKTTD